MIKEQSFEWLLEGCHRIADVAVASESAKSAAGIVCLLGRKGPAPFHCGTRLPAEGSDGPGLYRQDCPPHPRTDRHPPELLGDARPREGYDREKSVSSGL